MRALDAYRAYHSQDDLDWAARHRVQLTFASQGLELSLDLYPQAERDAALIVFNHGGGGYGRLFIPLARALHAKGYAVALPDQRGQGFSGGNRSDFLFTDFFRNVADAVITLRSRYPGRLILGGGSLGSAIAYGAQGLLLQEAPEHAAHGLILHNLYDFSPGGDALAVSRFAVFERLGLGWAARAQVAALAALMPGVRVPYRLVGDFTAMIEDPSGAFFRAWRRDPIPIKNISLRYMASLMKAAPPIALKDNPSPALVINPTADKMIPPALTHRNAQRLGGWGTDRVRYAEIPHGHFALHETFTARWSTLVDDWIKDLGP